MLRFGSKRLRWEITMNPHIWINISVTELLESEEQLIVQLKVTEHSLFVNELCILQFTEHFQFVCRIIIINESTVNNIIMICYVLSR